MHNTNLILLSIIGSYLFIKPEIEKNEVANRRQDLSLVDVSSNDAALNDETVLPEVVNILGDLHVPT